MAKQHEAPTRHVGEAWVDKFGRERQPEQHYYANDGTVTHGQAAIAAFDTDLAASRRRRTPRKREIGGSRPTRTRGSRRGSTQSRTTRASSSSSDDPGGGEPPSFGSWLRQRPADPHLVAVGRVDDWPERMLRRYRRDVGLESPRETQQPRLWDEVAA